MKVSPGEFSTWIDDWQRAAELALDGARELILNACQKWRRALQGLGKPAEANPLSLEQLIPLLPPLGEGRRLRVELHSQTLRLSFVEGVPLPFELAVGPSRCTLEVHSFSSWGWEKLDDQQLWPYFRRALLMRVQWRPKEVYDLLAALEEAATWLHKAAQSLAEVSLEQIPPSEERLSNLFDELNRVQGLLEERTKELAKVLGSGLVNPSQLPNVLPPPPEAWKFRTHLDITGGYLKLFRPLEFLGDFFSMNIGLRAFRQVHRGLNLDEDDFSLYLVLWERTEKGVRILSVSEFLASRVLDSEMEYENIRCVTDERCWAEFCEAIKRRLSQEPWSTRQEQALAELVEILGELAEWLKEAFDGYWAYGIQFLKLLFYEEKSYSLEVRKRALLQELKRL